jgi:hypothetical protein
MDADAPRYSSRVSYSFNACPIFSSFFFFLFFFKFYQIPILEDTKSSFLISCIHLYRFSTDSYLNKVFLEIRFLEVKILCLKGLACLGTIFLLLLLFFKNMFDSIF